MALCFTVDALQLKQEAPAVLVHRPALQWPSEGRIVIDNLQARYRDGLDLVLRGVSATIRPREKAWPPRRQA